MKSCTGTVIVGFDWYLRSLSPLCLVFQANTVSCNIHNYCKNAIFIPLSMRRMLILFFCYFIIGSDGRYFWNVQNIKSISNLLGRIQGLLEQKFDRGKVEGKGRVISNHICCITCTSESKNSREQMRGPITQQEEELALGDQTAYCIRCQVFVMVSKLVSEKWTEWRQ